MIWYFIILFLLASLAAFERRSAGSEISGKIAAFILIIFAGLRYETGFDWVEYENYFELTQPLFSDTPIYVQSSLLIEPGFAIFTLLSRTLSSSFQLYLFLISFINIVVIYFFARRHTPHIALVFLVYYGFAFLASQMAAIRQALSYSFVLLALMAFEDRRFTRSIVLSAIAISAHAFSAAIVAIIYLPRPRLPTAALAVIVGVGIATAWAGFHIVPLAADLFLPILGAGFLGTKLSLYGEYEGSAISLASLAFVPIHLLAYALLYKVETNQRAISDRLRSFAAWMALLSLISHSYFAVFPAFWNRLSYLTFLVEMVALSATYRMYLEDVIRRWSTIAAATLAGGMILAYSLSSPTSLPFTPYQNVLVAWVSGNPGDGRARYAYAFQQAEREIATRRR